TYEKIEEIDYRSRINIIERVKNFMIACIITIVLGILLSIGGELFIYFFYIQEGYMFTSPEVSSILGIVLLISTVIVPIVVAIFYSYLELKLRLDPNKMPTLYKVIRIILAVLSLGFIILISASYVQQIKQQLFKKVTCKKPHKNVTKEVPVLEEV